MAMMQNKLVSCVMPTRGREEIGKKAIYYFLAQTYPNKELVILDDLEESTFDKGPNLSWITYAVSTSQLIPNKRNTVNAIAKGEIICHFDSDDWSDPRRLESQMHLMQETDKEVIGFHSMLMADEKEGLGFRFNGPKPLDRYCLGTSLLYTKTFWQKHPFDESKAIASDVAFIDAAYSAKELATADAGSLMVARIHEGNTSKKRRDNCTNYQPIHWSELPEGFRNQAA